MKKIVIFVFIKLYHLVKFLIEISLKKNHYGLIFFIITNVRYKNLKEIPFMGLISVIVLSGAHF